MSLLRTTRIRHKGGDATPDSYAVPRIPSSWQTAGNQRDGRLHGLTERLPGKSAVSWVGRHARPWRALIVVKSGCEMLTQIGEKISGEAGRVWRLSNNTSYNKAITAVHCAARRWKSPRIKTLLHKSGADHQGCYGAALSGSSLIIRVPPQSFLNRLLFGTRTAAKVLRCQCSPSTLADSVERCLPAQSRRTADI